MNTKRLSVLIACLSMMAVSNIATAQQSNVSVVPDTMPQTFDPSHITDLEIESDSDKARYMCGDAQSVSERWFDRNAKHDAVIIATASSPADALASAWLQSSLNAPLMFVEPGKSHYVSHYAQQYHVEHTVILGGHQAVHPNDEFYATDHRPWDKKNVTRIYGDTRIETAVKLSEIARNGHIPVASEAPKGVLIVRSHASEGTDSSAEFADAIAASAYAAATNQIILLTPSTMLHPSVAKELEHYRNLPVTIVGGEQAISSHVEQEIARTHHVTRIAGDTRYLTSVALAKQYPQPKELIAIESYNQDGWYNGLASVLYSKSHRAPVIMYTNALEYEQLEHARMSVGLGSDVHIEYARTGVKLVQDRIIEETNVLRAKHGLTPLSIDPVLSYVARNWATEMRHRKVTADQSHNPNYISEARELYRAHGIKGGARGENVSYGAKNPYRIATEHAFSITNRWYNSPGHRMNMLQKSHTHIGVGISCVDGDVYAVQNFGVVQQ